MKWFVGFGVDFVNVYAVGGVWMMCVVLEGFEEGMLRGKKCLFLIVVI